MSKIKGGTGEGRISVDGNEASLSSAVYSVVLQGGNTTTLGLCEVKIQDNSVKKMVTNKENQFEEKKARCKMHVKILQ